MQHAPAEERFVSAVAAWAVWWVALFLLWQLLAGVIQAEELVGGALGAAVGATAALALRRRGYGRGGLDRAGPAAVGRGIAQMVPDVGRLARAALASPPPAGALHEAPSSAATSAGSSAGALAVVGASLAPNTIVVDVADDGRLLLHLLVPSEQAP